MREDLDQALLVADLPVGEVRAAVQYVSPQLRQRHPDGQAIEVDFDFDVEDDEAVLTSLILKLRDQVITLLDQADQRWKKETDFWENAWEQEGAERHSTTTNHQTVISQQKKHIEANWRASYDIFQGLLIFGE